MPFRRSAAPRLDLVQGTLDMLILRALSAGACHGYGIGQRIRAGSEDVIQVETGSLYPALHRLEKRGLVEAEWTVSERNQRARVYRLTAAGRAHLEAERARWERMTSAIARMLDARDSEAPA
jgi:transcriptional regulator